MKRKYGFIFMTLIIVTLLLSGCKMKTSVGLDIKKDGAVTITMITAMDNDMIDAMLNMGSSFGEEGETEQQTHTDEERWAYIDSAVENGAEGYKKEKYEKDGLKGYIYTKELGSIDELTAENSDEKVDIDNLTSDSKLFIKDGENYVINIKSSQGEEYKDQSETYSSYGAEFDIKFEVKLPGKAIKSNATSVKGTTYTWDLLKTNDIELKFNLNGSSSNTLLIVCTALAVVAVGACVAVVLIKKKK